MNVDKLIDLMSAIILPALKDIPGPIASGLIALTPTEFVDDPVNVNTPLLNPKPVPTFNFSFWPLPPVKPSQRDDVCIWFSVILKTES